MMRYSIFRTRDISYKARAIGKETDAIVGNVGRSFGVDEQARVGLPPVACLTTLEQLRTTLSRVPASQVKAALEVTDRGVSLSVSTKGAVMRLAERDGEVQKVWTKVGSAVAFIKTQLQLTKFTLIDYVPRAQKH